MSDQQNVKQPISQDHDAPTPAPELRRLDFLVGTWNIEGETSPEFAGPAMKSTSTETFEWLHGGFFLVHRWDAVFGDPAADPGAELPGGAVQKGIMFYGFDARLGSTARTSSTAMAPSTTEACTRERLWTAT